ncbi:MAG: flagellar hook-associated protein FlgL [Pseudomonadota bacterium]
MSQIRMGTAQLYATGLKSMTEIQRQVTQTQEQIASNKRILTPADDPLAATRVLQLDQELRQADQYDNTLQSLESRLQREEGALDGVSDLMLRAQELINESGNGALNAEQRGYLAVELQGIVDNMAQFMNTRDAGGEYLFAGHQGGQQPFVKGEDGRYRYEGDEGQRQVRIGPTTTVAANDPGETLFMDIEATQTTLHAEAHDGNRGQPPAVISDARVEDRQAFEQFHPDGVVIEFQPRDDVSPPGNNYTVRRSSDGRVLMQNVPHSTGDRVQFGGASVRIDGEPAPGDSFEVQTTDQQSLLGNLENYIEALTRFGDSAGDREALNAQRDVVAGNLDNARTRLLETRSSVGARLNTVENARDSNAELRQVTEEARSGLADLDYAEAISRLTQESFVLEAAQASFSRVNRLSLFNFL